MDTLRVSRRRSSGAPSSAAARIACATQHEAGKLTARERIDLLFDPGTFEELDKLVTHRCRDFGMDDQIDPRRRRRRRPSGRVDGRPVYAFAQDFTVFGGSLSETNAAKIVKVMDLAMKMGAPVVGLNDSGGARIQEGVLSLGGYADIFLRNTLASGVDSADLRHHGAVRRRRRLLAGDHRLQHHGRRHELHVRDRPGRHQDRDARGSHEGRARRRDDAQREERRRALRRARRSRVPAADSRAASVSCPATTSTIRRGATTSIRSIARTRRSIGSCRNRRTSRTTCTISCTSIVDDGAFLEVHRHFAKNIIVGFARLGGRPVGIVANQPAHLAGTLDIDASVKGARFVRFCDAFNIPLVTFEDVPGFLPGTRAGVRRHHPTRRQAAVCVRGSDRAEDDGHHAQGLRRRVLRDVEQTHPHRRQLRLADGGDRGDGAGGGGQHPLQARDRQRAPTRRPLARARVAEFQEKFANPYIAASRGFIDEVIRPAPDARAS